MNVWINCYLRDLIKKVDKWTTRALVLNEMNEIDKSQAPKLFSFTSQIKCLYWQPCAYGPPKLVQMSSPFWIPLWWWSVNHIMVYVASSFLTWFLKVPFGAFRLLLVQLFFRRNKFMLGFHPRFQKREGEHLGENKSFRDLCSICILNWYRIIPLSLAFPSQHRSKRINKWTSTVSFNLSKTTPICLKH